jgi:hypothetical protein
VGLSAASTLAHAEKNPLRDALPETHIHSWSFDAHVFGNTLTGPEEAYQFAMVSPSGIRRLHGQIKRRSISRQ